VSAGTSKFFHPYGPLVDKREHTTGATARSELFSVATGSNHRKTDLSAERGHEQHRRRV
jgi:hypothetical protein